MTQIAALGLSPQLQSSHVFRHTPGFPEAHVMAVENVLVRVPGSDPGGKALLDVREADEYEHRFARMIGELATEKSCSGSVARSATAFSCTITASKPCSAACSAGAKAT